MKGVKKIYKDLYMKLRYNTNLFNFFNFNHWIETINFT